MGYHFLWREAPIEDVPLPENEVREVRIFGRLDGYAGQLAAHLQAAGIRVEVCDRAGNWWEHAASCNPDRRTHLVCLWPLEAAALESADAIHLPARVQEMGESVLALGRGLAESRLQPRVYLVTGRACAVNAADTRMDLAQSVVWGMTRVIRNECPNVPIKLIDVDPTDPSLIETLAAEIRHWRVDADEVELAWRGRRRWLHELQPLTEQEADVLGTAELPATGPLYQLDTTERGLIENLRFRRVAPRRCSAGEVEIAVEATALNFKDVMNAMGLLNPRAVTGGLTGSAIGGEVAGHVVAVGPGVTDFRCGDAVLARVANGFANRVTAGLSMSPTSRRG